MIKIQRNSLLLFISKIRFSKDFDIFKFKPIQEQDTNWNNFKIFVFQVGLAIRKTSWSWRPATFYCRAGAILRSRLARTWRRTRGGVPPLEASSATKVHWWASELSRNFKMSPRMKSNMSRLYFEEKNWDNHSLKGNPKVWNLLLSGL